MPLFPEINETMTKKNAEKVLEGYPRWRRVAGDVGEQKITATYSFQPRQPYGTPSKAVERLALNKVEAEMELDAIEQAVSGLFNPLQRRVLYEKYMVNNPERDYIIYPKLGLSESLYYEIVDAALLAFAELYRHGEQVVLICGENVEKVRRIDGEKV